MNTTRYIKSSSLALAATSLLLTLGLQLPAQAQVLAQDGTRAAAQAGEPRDGRFQRGGIGRGAAGAGQGRGMPGPRMAGARDGAPLLERFDTLDTNDDSLLSPEELLAGPRQRIDRMFGCLDTDADGLLSKDELEARQGAGSEGRRELRACMQELGPDAAP